MLRGREVDEMGEQVKDPVCGMNVDADSAVTSEHMGKTFYFCAQGCKEKFDQAPMNYMSMEGEKKDDSCHM